MEPSLLREKRQLFGNAPDPSVAIREMKSVNSHLHRTRDLLHQSLDMVSNIRVGVSNTSSNLHSTSAMYDDYSEKLRKARMFTKQLKQKEEENSRKIKVAFWLLVASVVYILLRRILFPDLYRNLFRIF